MIPATAAYALAVVAGLALVFFYYAADLRKLKRLESDNLSLGTDLDKATWNARESYKGWVKATGEINRLHAQCRGYERRIDKLRNEIIEKNGEIHGQKKRVAQHSERAEKLQTRLHTLEEWNEEAEGIIAKIRELTDDSEDDS